LLAEALHLCHRRDRRWVAWRRWRSSSLDDLGSCLKREERRETETEIGERGRRALVRIQYGSPTKRCSQSSYTLWQGPRRSCYPVERESQKGRERERESQRGRESVVTLFLKSIFAPLSRRRETVVG
jgi:hypothetical protein